MPKGGDNGYRNWLQCMTEHKMACRLSQISIIKGAPPKMVLQGWRTTAIDSWQCGGNRKVVDGNVVFNVTTIVERRYGMTDKVNIIYASTNVLNIFHYRVKRFNLKKKKKMLEPINM